MTELECVIINVMLYAFSVIWSIKTKRYVVTLISLIWMICAAFGVLYFLNPFRVIPVRITIQPFLYLYVLYLITLSPFFLFTKRKMYYWHCGLNYKLFSIIITALAFCSYEPIIETVYTILIRGASNLSKAYENLTDPRSYFTFVGKYLFSVVDYFKFISPILFFIYVSLDIKREKWKYWGLILAVILPMLNNLANGQRFYVVLLTYTLIYNYLFFSRKIEPQIKKQLIKYCIIGASGISFLFIAISIARFGSGSSEKYGAAYQVIRYMGESMINFNVETYHITNYLYGHNSFVGFYSYFFGEVRDIQEQNSIIGVVTNVFSTFIGNFVMDYGLVTTGVLVLVTGGIMYRYVERNIKKMNLHFLIILYLYANILLFGTTYFIYQNGFVHMLFALCVAYAFKLKKKDIWLK